MRKHMATLAIMAAAAGLAAIPLQARERLTGEQELAKLLEGRVAGEPRSCIRTDANRSLTIIDKTAIVYKQGNTVWVNRTQHPESIDDDDVLIIKKFGGSGLCRTDTVTLADRTTGMFSGALFLTDFVPYKKAG